MSHVELLYVQNCFRISSSILNIHSLTSVLYFFSPRDSSFSFTREGACVLHYHQIWLVWFKKYNNVWTRFKQHSSRRRVKELQSYLFRVIFSFVRLYKTSRVHLIILRTYNIVTRFPKILHLNTSNYSRIWLTTSTFLKLISYAVWSKCIGLCPEVSINSFVVRNVIDFFSRRHQSCTFYKFILKGLLFS